MATQLKDIAFGDYLLKGEQNESEDGKTFTLSEDDVLGYMPSSTFTPIIAHDYSAGCSTFWQFHGVAEKALTAFSVGDGTNVALSQNNSSGVWFLDGVSQGALGFWTKGGSPSYRDFYDAVTVPSFEAGCAATAADEWIAAFVAAIGGKFVVTAQA